ncbi:aminoglycoside N(3)-acetyltransferase [Streptomyces sp. R39]|uniref:Aminoglycoside N(3)-acetyltransferase n=1 Tax=Streptomyces sp. R39 TaxID=3238631 RepID=A0AB39QDZ8_9ACTN
MEELTESEITEQLARLGIESGGTLMVHASMRSVGGGKGGAISVLNALRRLLGPDGTLVVPAFTSDNSDTSSAHQEQIRGLSDEARVAFRENMPPFDPVITPSTGMGVLAETVRCHANSIRSAHPQTSFAALGAQAAKIIQGHHLDCHLGKHSPLARLYDMRAQVLLLGVGFDRCTAFHLGEYRVMDPPRRTYRCVIRKDGMRQWWEYEDVALDDSDFGRLGEDFERVSASGAVRKGRVGSASCRLLSFVDAVDYAQSWFLERRVTGYGRGPGC